jgi:hypothetical protein
MARATYCPTCQKSLRLPEDLLGKKVRCPACGNAFVAAAPTEPEIVEVLPVVPKEEQATGADTEPGGRGAPSSRHSVNASPKPLSFTVAIQDPDGISKGKFQARLTTKGINLSQKGNQSLLPVGSPSRYLSSNVLEVTCEGRELRLTVTKRFSYQNRLAQDLASFLDGSGTMPRAAAYALPWYFFIPVALPMGIPVVTLGGAIPAAVGCALAGANFALIQRETWPKMARLTITLSLALGAYLVLGLLWLSVAGRIKESAWQSFSPADGQFSVLLPGQPKEQTQTKHTAGGRITTVLYLVDLKHSAYIVGYSPIPPGAHVELDAVRDEVVARHTGRLVTEQPISIEGHAGREFVLEISNPKGGGVMRVFRVGDRLYQLLAFGSQVTASSADARKFLESFQLTDLRRAADSSRANQPQMPKGEPTPPQNQQPAPKPGPQPGGRWERSEENLAKGYVRVRGLQGEVRSLAFTSDGSALAVAAGEEVLILGRGDRSSRILRDGTDQVLAMGMTPDGQRIVTGRSSGRRRVLDAAKGELGLIYRLQVWDVMKHQLRLTLEEKVSAELLAIAVSPDGKMVAVGWSDGSVRLWDVEPWRERERLRGPTRDLIRSLAFSRDGRWLASECTDTDKTIRIWDLKKRQERTHLGGGSSNPFGNSLAFTTDGRFLAAFGPKQTLKIWEVDSGKEMQSWRVSTDTRCLALSPDDRLLATGNGDGFVAVFDWRTGQSASLADGRLQLGGVTVVSFSPDSRSLAAGGLAELRIWDLSRALSLK